MSGWPTTRRYSRRCDSPAEYAGCIWLDNSPRARLMRWLRRLFA